MKTMYRTDYWDHKTIETIQVIRETAKMVEVEVKAWEGRKTRRMKKEGQVFPTFADAKTYLVEDAKREVEEASRRLAKVQSRYAEVLALTEDDVKSA